MLPPHVPLSVVHELFLFSHWSGYVWVNPSSSNTGFFVLDVYRITYFYRLTRLYYVTTTQVYAIFGHSAANFKNSVQVFPLCTSMHVTHFHRLLNLYKMSNIQAFLVWNELNSKKFLRIVYILTYENMIT